jgi:hypothetical protein
MTAPQLTSPDIPVADLIAYAGLVLDIGAPVRDDDLVVINAEIDHAPLARALAEGAYARGARYVDIWYFDPHAKRSRIRHAGPATLPEVPSLEGRVRAHVPGAEHRSPEGPQVGDVNMWNRHNPRERLWAARSRQLQRARHAVRPAVIDVSLPAPARREAGPARARPPAEQPRPSPGPQQRDYREPPGTVLPPFYQDAIQRRPVLWNQT